METNQNWHQVRIIAKPNCLEPTEPALPKKLVQAEFTLHGRTRLYTPYTLEFKVNARARWVMMDFLVKEWHRSSLRKKNNFSSNKKFAWKAMKF